MTHPALDRRDISLREAVDAIATARMMSAPGEVMVYGDASFQVAGRIAEIVSGQAWTALFASRLTGPLGMTATSFGATGNPHLAGGATSSAADYANFLVMLLRQGMEKSFPMYLRLKALLRAQVRPAQRSLP